MDFSLPQSVAPIVERVSSFVRDELVPLERRFISQPFADLVPTLDEKRARAKELGLWAPHLPREIGGLGLSLTEFAPISEALGRTPLGHYVANCQAPDAGNMEILLHFGTDE